MRYVSMKPILGTVALATLLAGCATTVEMGPGYYHYDVGAARVTTPPVTTKIASTKNKILMTNLRWYGALKH